MAPKRSIAWDHFVDKGNDKALCKICKIDISYKASVSNLTKHMKRKHGSVQLVQRENEPVPATQRENDVVASDSTPGCSSQSGIIPLSSSAAGTSTSGVQKSRNAAITSFMRRDCSKIKKDIDSHIMNLFIFDLQPFSMVEDRGFRELISFAFPNYVIPSRKYFANNMLPSLYEAKKTEMKEMVKSEIISVCLTTDMWTSRNGDWFLAVTGHFIDSNMALRSILLECCALQVTSHTAAVLAEELLRIVQEWDIQNKILLAISDNGSNIKCAIEKLLGWKHFSCYAHSLNLAVEKALENETVTIIINKCKTIVAYFKKSNSAWEKLKRYLEQAGKPIKRPLQEVMTRWNSKFYMLERLLELKEEVNSALSNLNTSVPTLSANEWSLIEKLLLVLKPCEEVSKEMSGEKYVTGSSVIPVTIVLQSALTELILDGSEPLPDVIEQVRQDLYGGITRRFSTLENSKTLTTCMFLDPRFKLFFENETTATTAKQHVIGLVTTLICSETQVAPEETTEEPTNVGSSVWKHYYNTMKNIRPNGTAYSRAVVEVQRYLDDKIIKKSESPLEWWIINKNSYPHLYILARQKLNALATSVPCERLFSVAGNIISERRTRLGCRKLQQLLFLQQNS